jgi:hydrogenase nickel incorporation protein HypA/HybF
MGNILDIVKETAEKNGAKRVTRIELLIGMMSDILPDWAQNYFDMLSKDTVADGAVLVIERVPVTLMCRQCKKNFEMDMADWNFKCPTCVSSDVELVTGRELAIKNIEIEQ